jgi:tetratricopeptide (TPR) repeat protein
MNLTGSSSLKMGPEEALARVSGMISQKPKSPELRNLHGTILIQLGRKDEAVASFRAAIALNPNLANLHLNLAQALVEMGMDEEALASYSQALAIHPESPGANFGLATLLEKLNRISDLERVVESVVTRIGTSSPLIAYIAGLLAFRKKDLLGAEAVLAGIDGNLLNDRQRTQLYGLLGKVYDQTGRYREAFRLFQSANNLTLKRPHAVDFSAKKSLDRVEKFISSYKGAPPTRWPDYTPSRPIPQLVFLVGFPRSGTTLLDTILRSHPRILVLEEKPTVYAMRHRIDDDQRLERLNRLTQVELRGIADAYFDELGKHVEVGTKNQIIVDKLPLNLVSVALIKRVFPQAKFILALRHPCDCVLSGFMQSFALNDAMMNFLSLRDSAVLYDRVMTLWRAYEATLSPEYHIVKYEEVIAKFEVTILALLEFLGLEWDDAVERFRETALRRGRISTPSYRQVTEDLHARAAGRWLNYRQEMEPVLPILNPWISAWGY